MVRPAAEVLIGTLIGFFEALHYRVGKNLLMVDCCGLNPQSLQKLGTSQELCEYTSRVSWVKLLAYLGG